MEELVRTSQDICTSKEGVGASQSADRRKVSRRAYRKPRRPQYPKGGNESAKREWRDRLDIYKLDYAEWEQQSKALDAVNE